MHEEKITQSGLKAGIQFAILATILLFCGGRRDWGWGFVIGGFLSLLSLFSLTVLVPMLFRPGTNCAKGILTLTLFMKLPLYLFLLSFVSQQHGVEPIAAVLGI